jgi:hypothetical protein
MAKDLMSGQRFENGKFTDVADMSAAMGVDLPLSWDNMEAMLKEVGWFDGGRVFTIGDSEEDWLTTQLYEGKGGVWLAVLDMVDTFEWVLLGSFGNMLEYVRYIQPMVAGAADQRRAERHESRLRRSIAHRIRHDPDSPCHLCESDVERLDRTHPRVRR